MTRRKTENRLKSYILAFLVTLAIFTLNLVILQAIIPMSLPGYLSTFVFGILLSPSIVIWLYVLYWTLAPITERMPLRSFKQWLLLWPFIAGFTTFWAFLSFLFEALAPSLPREDRETTLPILIIVVITFVISTTKLRYPVARLLNRIFGTEPMTSN